MRGYSTNEHKINRSLTGLWTISFMIAPDFLFIGGYLPLIYLRVLQW